MATKAIDVATASAPRDEPIVTFRVKTSDMIDIGSGNFAVSCPFSESTQEVNSKVREAARSHLIPPEADYLYTRIKHRGPHGH